VGICVVLNKKNISTAIEEITRNKGLLWICGFIIIVLGAVLIAFNNDIPGSRLSLLVTILGWLSIIKGAYLLIFPNSAASIYKTFNKGWIFVTGGIIAIIVGLILVSNIFHSSHMYMYDGSGQQGLFNQQVPSNLPSTGQ
jgi:membrane protease YdiL (CAAX protease family)